MIAYCARRKTHFVKLKKEGWDVPDDLKAYMLYCDANLPEKARELVELWSKGLYKWEDMQLHFKHLERPILGPPSLGGTKTRMIGFTTGEIESEQDFTDFPASPFLRQCRVCVHGVFISYVYINTTPYKFVYFKYPHTNIRTFVGNIYSYFLPKYQQLV